MNYTLSKYALAVMAARGIRKVWVENTIETPSLKIIKASNEVNLFSSICENENRCLNMALNPIFMIVATAYFDRNMKKKGCK